MLKRTWRAGDDVSLRLEMPVERLYAHPAVKTNIGRVCLKYGPLVYCVEGVDNPGIAPTRARLPRDAEIGAVDRPDLFDGIIALVANGEAVSTESWEDALYRRSPTRWKPQALTLIPYYLWDNRDPCEMMVWLAER